MTNVSARSVTLSLALLLASTSLAQAGFIWLSPEDQAKPNVETPYTPQTTPPTEAPSQAREWKQEAAPAAAPAQIAAAPVTQSASPTPNPAQVLVPPAYAIAEPTAAAAQAPAPVDLAPVASAPATPAAVLRDETVSASPIYAKGDQTPAAIAAPASVPASAPVSAAAQVPTTAPATPTVTLASSTAPADTVSAAAMPTAESLVNTMPVTPSAKVADVAVSVPPVAAPTPTANVVELASAKPEITMTPASVTAPNVIAEPPAPTSAKKGSQVSLVTGQAIAPAALAAVPAATPSNEVIANGFGKRVPLVIAIRQILPSNYGFAHGEGVDLTTSVDWQGGRPWSQVLSDAIKPVGLTAIVRGQTVMLVRADSAAATATQAMGSTPAAGASAVLTNATVMQTPPKN